MRSRWFHVPRLHLPSMGAARAGGLGDASALSMTAGMGSKGTSWLAIFYDLVVAAAIARLGEALAGSLAQGEGLFGVAQVAGYFVPFWLAWTGFTFFEGRFTVDDFVQRTVVFLQMVALVAMGATVPSAIRDPGPPRAFAFATAAALGLVALMHLRARWQVERARDYSGYWGGVYGVSATLWGVSAAVPFPWAYLLWGVGSVAILGSPLSARSRTLVDELPFDLAYLAKRYGLLVLFVLGSGLVPLFQLREGAVLGGLGPALLGLAAVAAVWWIYFDDVAGSTIRQNRGAWIIWLYGHVPLTFGVLVLMVAIETTFVLDLTATCTATQSWLLTGGFALTLASVGVVDAVTERRQAELSDRARVISRLVASASTLLVGALASSMTVGVVVGATTAIGVGLVLFDMAMAPFDAVMDREATGLAEIARRRQRGEDEARPRRDLSEAVRRGIPSERRQDLYFFFIEGSWSRLLGALVVVYVLVNFLFAGLYLLEPESIGIAPQDFVDAFSFSVQTMSTIGYGKLSPETNYGHLMVAIEAAVGLLGVAVATGLIFAKVSLPRSGAIFSNNVVVTKMDGVPTLVFRCGNARGNEVVEATMRVAALVDSVSKEGHHLRRIVDLPLVRDRSPVFTLSWTIMHTLDETSPLAGVDWSRPGDHLITVIATMLGHDATYGTTTHARHLYYPEDIVVGHHFVDVISQLDDGRLMIDYTRFHDVEPDIADDEGATG